MNDPIRTRGHQILEFGCSDFTLSGRHQRKTHDESCAQTFTRALGLDCATMYFDQVTNDRQSQPKPPVCPGARSIGLTEAVKYSRHKVRLDPFAGITHRDYCM